jgi:Icc-related predicted phosphoesterase
MKILYATDLHGSEWKYDRIFQLLREHEIDIVINGGDMYPKEKDLFSQNRFIIDYLDSYFAKFNEQGIYYLCFPGNEDLQTYTKKYIHSLFKITLFFFVF